MDLEYRQKAEAFVRTAPYKQEPYRHRNWGHPWHSLCSYHGKLKPAIAHWLVREFTAPGDVVLDPLCGVGTIPFEACLQGRVGLGNDLSELAYIVTKAKLERPAKSDALAVLAQLEDYLAANKGRFSPDAYSDFGFNGKLPAYFEENTYREILCAREFFLARLPDLTPAEAMVYSAFLHVLHGNRPYALSRRSHPLTPYAPSGAFVYKSVVEKIGQKLSLNYKCTDFAQFTPGAAFSGDYKTLLARGLRADCILCSPPFANSMRFYMQNWMRLWLCGWEAADYKTADSRFLDKQQEKDFDVYLDFFQTCSALLVPGGKMILHLGKTRSVDMGQELSRRAAPWFEVVWLAGEDVSLLEKHGITDKGSTVEHQFLFLQKK